MDFTELITEFRMRRSSLNAWAQSCFCLSCFIVCLFIAMFVYFLCVCRLAVSVVIMPGRKVWPDYLRTGRIVKRQLIVRQIPSQSLQGCGVSGCGVSEH